MKRVTYFKNFLDDIVNINQTRLNTLDQNVEALHSFLLNHDSLSGVALEAIPQGSWAHQTIIKPLPDREFDADFLLEMKLQPDWSPREYLSSIRSALASSDRYKTKVARKNRCVRVAYAGDHHVDIVPFLRLDDGTGQVVRWDEDIFELTNPEGYTSWFDDQNDSLNGYLRHVVRLLKHLRDSKGTFTAKSVILTTLLAARVETVASPPDLPTALYNVTAALADYLANHDSPPSVPDPSMPGMSFDHRWPEDDSIFRNFRDKMRFYSDKMEAALSEDSEEESLALWREIFGDEFGVVADATTVARVDGERFLQDIGISVPASLPHQVTVRCTVENRRGYRNGDLRRMGTVGVNRQLVFEVASCDAPQPYRVFWKIRNTGAVAARAGCLRGDLHEASSRTESTKYRGQHWVECYIVHQRTCVARRRYPVRIR